MYIPIFTHNLLLVMFWAEAEHLSSFLNPGTNKLEQYLSDLSEAAQERSKTSALTNCLLGRKHTLTSRSCAVQII